jgi:hypothetical protein
MPKPRRGKRQTYDCTQCGVRISRNTRLRTGGYCEACAVTPPTSSTNEPGGKLMEDLAFYADEAYTKGDVRAGLKLLGELAGLASIVSVLITALTVWIPAIGIPIASASVFHIIRFAVQGYSELNADDRHKVRAAVSWLKGGVNLIN